MKKNQQFIMEVIRIDANLDKITIYQPNNGKGCLISNRPPSPPLDRDNYLQFDYKSLPQSYWKKYDLASKFVKMVRSRTPKITLHTDLSKCILYDTSPDFEALFYQGAKFHVSKEGLIKITQIDGTSISMVDSNSRSTCLSPETQEMLELTHKWHKYCLDIESLFQRQEALFQDIVSFPLTIGRRPTQTNSNKQTSNISSNNNNNNNNTHSSGLSHHPSTSVDDSSSNFGSFQHHSNINTNSGTATVNSSSNNHERNMRNNSSLISNQNFELKSASTSSLATALNGNNNNSSSEMRMYQSYQNENDTQYSNSNRVRKLTTYDSLSSSPSPLTLPLSNSNDIILSNQMHNHSNHPLSSMSSHSLNSSTNNNRQANSYRPQSSSSSSSSNHQNQYLNQYNHHHQQQQQQQLPLSHNLHHYDTQNSYTSNQITSSHQYQLNRQMSIPSPSSLLVNAMTPLSLVSNQQQQQHQQNVAFDNVPISLPQRDLNYFN